MHILEVLCSPETWTCPGSKSRKVDQSNYSHEYSEMQYDQCLGRFRSPTRTCGSVGVSRSGQVIGENSGVIVLQVAGTGGDGSFPIRDRQVMHLLSKSQSTGLQPGPPGGLPGLCLSFSGGCVPTGGSEESHHTMPTARETSWWIVCSWGRVL